ncbi:putative uncharacterized protein DDB_G0282133 [Phymastichus coffea]|uniref:putative uncharacterized protein DDB_G0282133 n=1 Tax=Phymastichus coffea TaxID=108790 RepID=UPI00273C3DA4|nr:putative uncharacterized protein DDB_G0282133 [Phymastichus coffea]XP_058796504.1 putative uncharacterized protein DDB_G0282133 [Phymastichus coffea]
MSAGTRNKQLQTHNTNNGAVQSKKSTILKKIYKVGSLHNFSSDSIENIDNHVKVASKCGRTSIDTCQNEISHQSDKQSYENLEKFTVNSIEPINEQLLSNDKIDNLITKTDIGKNMNDFPNPDQVTELSDDYLIQMTKNLNDRHIALYEGIFLKADEDDKNGFIDEKKNENNDNIKEKSTAVYSDIEKDNAKGPINESDSVKIDCLLNEVGLDNSNNPNDIVKIKLEVSIKNNHKVVPSTDDNKNIRQKDGTILVDQLAFVDVKKSYTQAKLRDTPSVKSEVLINRLQNMDWLKPSGHEMLEVWKKISRKRPNLTDRDKEEKDNEDIEDPVDDTKLNSKSNKKRSNQRKNIKTKVVDSFKKDEIEDQSKKSLNDVIEHENKKSSNDVIKDENKKSSNDVKEDKSKRPSNEVIIEDKSKKSLNNVTEDKSKRLTKDIIEDKSKKSLNNVTEDKSKRSSNDVTEVKNKKSSNDVIEDKSKKSSNDVIEVKNKKYSNDVIDDKNKRPLNDVIEGKNKKSLNDVIEDENKKSSNDVKEDKSKRSSNDVTEVKNKKSSNDVTEDKSKRSSNDVIEDKSKRPSNDVIEGKNKKSSNDVIEGKNKKSSNDVKEDKSKRSSNDVTEVKNKKSSNDVTEDKSKRSSNDVIEVKNKKLSNDVIEDKSKRPSNDVIEGKNKKSSNDVIIEDKSKKSLNNVTEDKSKRPSNDVKEVKNKKSSNDVIEDKSKRSSNDVTEVKNKKSSNDVTEDKSKRSSNDVTEVKNKKPSNDVIEDISKRSSNDVIEVKNKKPSNDVIEDKSIRSSNDVIEVKNKKSLNYIIEDESKRPSNVVIEVKNKKLSNDVIEDKSKKSSNDVIEGKSKRLSNDVIESENKKSSNDVIEDKNKRSSNDIIEGKNKKSLNNVKDDKNKLSSNDVIESENIKSSNDVGLINTSKNESSKSPVGQVTDKSKDAKSSQLPASQRTCIGRGRNDRRKISSGNVQLRGQSDINNQRNESHKSFKEDKLPITVENSSSKTEAHFNLQDSSDKIKKIDVTENLLVITDAIKSKEQKVYETKSDSKSYQNIESHIQPPVKNIAELPAHKNKSKIDIKKDQLSSKDYQESQNRSASNQPSRSTQVQLTDKSISEKTVYSVKGFGQKTDETVKNNNQPCQSLSSKDSSNRFSEQTNKNSTENKINQSYSSLLKSKEESCSIKDTDTVSTHTTSSIYDRDFPRWNHSNNYPDKQNINRDEITLHPSNRQRNISDNKRENEESFGKHQVFIDKSQGNKRYSDKTQNSGTSVGRYSNRNQEIDNFLDKHSEKNQDDKNYAERYSNKNQNSKSYHDTDSDRLQTSRRDTYVNNNYRNQGFSERFSDINEDKPYGNHSYKFRDNKNSGDRYPDNQQSQTSNDRFCNKTPENKSTVNFDKNKDEKTSDKNQIATRNSDFSSGNTRLPDRKNESPNLSKATCNRSYNMNENTCEVKTYEKENKDGNNHQTFNKDNNYKNQDTTNNTKSVHNGCYPYPHEQQQLKQFKNNCWKTSDRAHSVNETQCGSDVKSQKYLDSTQQINVQIGSKQIQQSYPGPSVASPQELSSAINQNIELHGGITQFTDMTGMSQPNQSEHWNSHKNTSKQEAVYPSEFQSASPYANINIASSPTVTNEYNLQYHQTLLNSSNQLNSTSTSGQKSNIVMTFDGNQNVQRALGMNHRIMNQLPYPQTNTNDPSEPNTNIPVPSPSMYTDGNVTQFFQTAVSNLQTIMPHMHSTMNVNAQPFEVIKQSNQEPSKQKMYAMQPLISNQNHSRSVSSNNDNVIDEAYKNEKSNDSEEYLKLRKEICDLSQQLAAKQGQLLALELRWHKNECALHNKDSNIISQQSCQHVSSNQRVQESDNIWPPSYAQPEHSCFPLSYDRVPMGLERTEGSHLYKLLTETLPPNSIPKLGNNPPSVYLAQGNMYQQDAAAYQMFTEKTGNRATYVNMVPQNNQFLH